MIRDNEFDRHLLDQVMPEGTPHPEALWTLQSGCDRSGARPDLWPRPAQRDWAPGSL